MRRRKFEVYIFLLILLGFSYFFPQFTRELKLSSKEVLSENIALPSAVSSNTNEQAGKVTRVIDGDTIAVYLNGKEEKVRVIGINSPETVDPRKEVGCFGKEAFNRAKSLLTNQTVTLKLDTTQANIDRYGRLLRYVYFADGSDFGLKMINEGYAYEYTYDVPYLKQKMYKEAQRAAENLKKGLWGNDVCKK